MTGGNDLSCVMIIFGGTGDLTHRKLIPAIYNLKHEDMLSEKFAIVSVGRRDMTDDEYRDDLYESVKKFSRFKIDDNIWGYIRNRIFYRKFDFSDDSGYGELKHTLSCIDKEYGTNGNRVYYLAVAPDHFDIIVDKLHNHNMAENTISWQRVVIEKPFGRDLESAKYLNQRITGAFSENNIYRIDHYLGKEMIQNIMIVRFANSFFEPVWNSRFIDNIQISSSETLGIENRGDYYDKAGALRDMVQNHMLQLLTLTAMEPPAALDTESIRDEKVKVLRCLEPFTPELADKYIVRGQYCRGIVDGTDARGYREEAKVSPTSTTETFLAMKLRVKNFRWGDIPFYIRTGKRMKSKSTEIVIQFRHLPQILYFKEFGKLEPNLLVIRIQPREGISFQVNAKKPGIKDSLIPIQMDFCQNCKTVGNSPEAYERLLLDVIKGDSTLFTRWDEVEYSWRFVDSIYSAWKNSSVNLSQYEPGTWGPSEADALLERNSRKWWNL